MALGRLSIGTIPNTFFGVMPQATKAMNATSSISLYISMTIRNTKSKTSNKQENKIHKTKRQKVKGAAKGFLYLDTTPRFGHEDRSETTSAARYLGN